MRLSIIRRGPMTRRLHLIGCKIGSGRVQLRKIGSADGVQLRIPSTPTKTLPDSHCLNWQANQSKYLNEHKVINKPCDKVNLANKLWKTGLLSKPPDYDRKSLEQIICCG